MEGCESMNDSASYTQVTGKLDLINRQDAIEAFWKLDIELRPSAIDVITDMLKTIPSAEPERILVAQVTLSQEQIQDAVDKAVEKMKAELEPCDFCKHKDDCGDMALYCPSERRTDG